MYTKDKNHRITLRLNEDQFAFVASSAERLDVSPSDFLRMVINNSMFIQRDLEKKADEAFRSKEGNGRENDKANQHNIV